MSSREIKMQAEALPADETVERILLVLLLDTSGSMLTSLGEGAGARAVTRMDELNESLAAFLATGMHALGDVETYGEVAIGAFHGAGLDWLKLDGPASSEPFHFVRGILGTSPVAAVPKASTPMAEAIVEAMSRIEARKDALRAEGIVQRFRPCLFLLTDGEPSGAWHHVPPLLRTAEKNKKLLFYAFGTYEANMDVLRTLAPKATYELRGRRLQQVIDLLSASIAADNDGGQSADEIYEVVRERNELYSRDSEFLEGT